MPSNSKPRAAGKQRKSHHGQAQSVPRKRARQRANAARLANEAAVLGVTLLELAQRKAQEKAVIVQTATASPPEWLRPRRERYGGIYRSYYD